MLCGSSSCVETFVLRYSMVVTAGLVLVVLGLRLGLVQELGLEVEVGLVLEVAVQL